MESSTASGLTVVEHRRAFPRDVTPNPNPQPEPPVSVGPNASEGFGNTHVMYPVGGWSSSAWSGWPVDWATPPMEPLGTNAYSGDGYGRFNNLFSRVSTAMNAIDLNSRQLASFPVYGVKGSIPFDLPEWRNNPEPELHASWADFMHGAVNSLLLRGECVTYATGRYAPPTTGGPGRVARFTTLNPDLVDIELIEGRRVVTLAGAELNPADVCVVRYQAWPGRVRGVTPIEWLGSSLLTSGALERYASGLATRGGIPWAVLHTKSHISGTQAVDLQDRWVGAAARRDGAPAVLGGDFELEPLTISPRDMALLELREFDERRIAAAFGVPAYLLNIEQQGLTYANASQLFEHHWTATLRPLANLLAEAWSAWLLPHGSRLEFNPDRYVQPPMAERVAAWATMFNIVDPASGQRAMTVDEIRAAERLMPSAEELAPTESDAERLTGATV